MVPVARPLLWIVVTAAFYWTTVVAVQSQPLTFPVPTYGYVIVSGGAAGCTQPPTRCVTPEGVYSFLCGRISGEQTGGSRQSDSAPFRTRLYAATVTILQSISVYMTVKPIML